MEQWWPQAAVMPHAAAVVGHGGFGTTMAALAAGVPQVIVPLFALDQRINAEYASALSAAVTLEGGPAAVSVLTDAVTRLLEAPEHRQAARGIAEAMAALPPVADAVTRLEQIASQ